MSTYYCYIDYSKSKSNKFVVEGFKPCNEIKIDSNFADIYFSISNSDELSLSQSSRYILLSNGTFENSEDLLNLLEEKNIEEILDEVLGIYSLIVYDKKYESLYMTRDHFGLTNLFFYQKDDVLLFSNRLKTFKYTQAFKKELDYDTLGQYLQYGYIFQPHTIFKNTQQLKSAHFLKLDLSTKDITVKRYWCSFNKNNKKRENLSVESIVQMSEILLTDLTHYIISIVK